MPCACWLKSEPYNRLSTRRMFRSSSERNPCEAPTWLAKMGPLSYLCKGFHSGRDFQISQEGHGQRKWSSESRNDPSIDTKPHSPVPFFPRRLKGHSPNFLNKLHETVNITCNCLIICAAFPGFKGTLFHCWTHVRICVRGRQSKSGNP